MIHSDEPDMDRLPAQPRPAETAPEAQESREHDRGAAPADATRGVVRKVMLGTVLGALVLAALAFYADAQQLRQALVSLDVRYFALALVLATSNYALRFLRWQYYLRAVDVHIPVARSARVFVSGFVMSVTPGKLGEVFKSMLLFESDGVPLARTAPIVLAERITDLIALVTLAALGSLAFPEATAAALLGALTVIALLAMVGIRPVGNFALSLGARLPLVRRAVPPAREALESLRTMLRPAALLTTSVLSMISWSLECAALFALVHGFPDHTITPLAAAFSYAAPTIVGALAMLPGGVGLTEAGMTGALLQVGGATMTRGSAGAITILIRLATLWWAVLLGLVALFAFRRHDVPNALATQKPATT
ncbi:MAG: flippase-like domain-containing protein [Sandaracinaceae bacterium]|nr:flippase-like domain-containing protein [Myxococcales bacterium]MCB9659127.1 flippase-like domain-containing protein [Sandaracinaceae bacterium]